MMSYRFFKMAAIKSEIYFRLRFRNGTALRRWISIRIPNFDEISQSTAKNKLLPVSENGQPPLLNSISGFYFCLIFIIGVSFCIVQLLVSRSSSNLVLIRYIVSKILRYLYFGILP